MSLLFSFYLKLSPIIQNIFLNIQGYRIQRTRFSSDFEKELFRFEKSNPKEINIELLKQFLTNAEQSTFWKERFSQYKVDIKSNNPIAEIEKLPILTKGEVQENADLIRINNLNDKIKKIHTSGTTGSGLVFQQTQLMENKQWAVWWRYRRWHGINRNMWMGWFGGRTIMDIATNKSPFWRVNYFGRQVMFSAHHLSFETVYHYHKAILDKKLKWLHGYPSQLAYLATLIKENGLDYIKMDYITVGAENLLSHQIDIIKEVFGVLPIQHYGLSEGVANISQIPSGELQVDQDFAMVEFLPTDFDKDLFKIIGTNYSNFAFPLIRYDTNDLIRVKKVLNEEYRVISVDGRNEDFVTLPNGVKLGRLDHIFKNATFVKEAQIYQPDIFKIELRVVPAKSYKKDIHENILNRECKERFGNDIEISFRYYDQLPRTKSGKLKFVISEV